MKIKKLITGLVVAGAMTVSGAVLAGCGELSPKETSYNMASLETEYDVDEQVSFVGRIMEIEMSDGTKQNVEITDDMVKSSPDMSTTGNKTLVISYNGKDYTFTFKVTDKKSELIAKLNTFMEHYNLKQKKGDINVKVGYNITSTFMGNVSNTENSASGALTYEQIKSNELIKYVYNTVLDKIVRTTTNIDKSNISDANNFKIKSDFIEEISAILNSITAGDSDELTKTLLNYFFGYLPSTDEISKQVAKTLCITSEEGKAEVYSIINSAIVDIKSIEEVDLLKIISNLNDAVKEYADQKPISTVIANYLKLNTFGQKQLEALIYDTIHVCTTQNKQNYTIRGQFDKLYDIVATYSTDTTVKEVFETFISTIDYTGDNFLSENLRNILLTIKNTNNDEFLDAFANCLCDIIKEVEDAVKASNTDDTYNVMTTYNNIVSKLTTFINTRNTIENLTSYESKIYDFAIGFKDIFSVADENILTFILNIYNKFDFAQILVANNNLPTQVADIINNLVEDVLTQNTEIDFGNYIDLVCEIFDIDETKAQEYKTDFETNHKCNIVSDILTARLGTEVEVFAKVIDLVKYAEDNLGKDTFSKDEILSKASVLATAIKENQDLLTSISLLEKVLDDVNSIIENLRTDEEIQYRNFIKLVFDILNINTVQGIDADKICNYIDDLVQNHKCNIISDYLEYSLDSANQENALIVELVKYIEDNLGKDTFSVDVFLNKLGTLATTLKTKNVLPMGNEPLLDAVICFTNQEQTVEENFKDLLKIYKNDIVNVTTNVLTLVIVPNDIVDANDVTATKEYLEFKSLLDYNFTKYLNNETVDVEKFVKDFANIVNKYADATSKIRVQSLALACAVIVGPQEDVDYNEYMSFYKLPDEIESIDYNVLIEKLHNEATYEDLIDISDLDVQFVTDEQGNIRKEVLTINITSAFDCIIANYNGGIQLSFEILF